ncbi:chromosome-associated kinesin KIF4-like [Populus alba x Populus x berolinensis]|uniref:Chromosome-associated kinesin KIF4-like n=1 Tax=Populus alba x Populus x berolinensis TaxID=444605 RepID=A0AAD6R0D6_9ROSI|nr:chromosome-associated kinesin KIF4-like [Populus alba x Populus x berolinensis]
MRYRKRFSTWIDFEKKKQGMESSECVRVASFSIGCTDIITVVPGEPQVQIGSHSFTYDYVYGSTASPSLEIFNDCVAPLV